MEEAKREKVISDERIERAEQAEQVWHESKRQLENGVACGTKTLNRPSMR